MTEPFKLPLHIELPMTKKYAGPLMVFDADGGYLFLAWPHVAEPIVRAANAHDRLVAALTGIVECYDMRAELYTSDEDCAGNLYDKAKKALAEIDGEKGNG